MSKKDVKYKVGDIVMLKENLLKVEIVAIKKPFFSGTRFIVRYAHLPKKLYNDTFGVSIREIDDVPYDYNQEIFNAYVKLLVEHKNLLTKEELVIEMFWG